MQATQAAETRSIKWNTVFRPVNQCRTRYRVLRGSAGSGKSVDIAQDYIKKLSDERYRGANLLVVRKVEETNRDSTFAELQAAVYRLFGEHTPRVWKVTLNPLSMECLLTGCRIIFRGMNDQRQREKVKSITFKHGKLTWIWVEEATELLKGDIEILDDRLRGELDNPNLYYQITLTFNPVSSSHWIKARYFDKEDPDVFTHHSTFLDNRFSDPAFRRRQEKRKEHDPEGYKVYALGEWGETGGLILTNWRCHMFDTRIERFEDVACGQDFGVNHANALLLLGWRDGEVYVLREDVRYDQTTNDIIHALEGRWPKNIPMWCDTAGRDQRETWRRAGYTVRETYKGPGSVLAQIDWLRGRKLHIHPSCAHLMKELQSWKWRVDRMTGEYIDEPVAIGEDAISALRYGTEGWREHGSAPKRRR